MKSRPRIVWRVAAAVLWIISIACLAKAISGGAGAEESLVNPHLSDANRIASQHQAEMADRWAAVGWALQFVTAAVLSVGIGSARIVRRIFVSLGVLIAADGVVMLAMAVIVR